MKKPSSYSVSSLNLRADATSQRRAINKLFQAASKKAPMFQKKSSSGKIYAYHVASSHAFKTLSSLAAATIAEQLEADSNFLRQTPRGELSRAPAMASMPAGSILVLEQVLTAFAQTAFLRAERLRKAARKTEKVSHTNVALAAKCLASEVNAVEGVAVVRDPPKLKYRPAPKKEAKV